eukprot:3937818-Rhodomonas_salina.1
MALVPPTRSGLENVCYQHSGAGVVLRVCTWHTVCWYRGTVWGTECWDTGWCTGVRSGALRGTKRAGTGVRFGALSGTRCAGTGVRFGAAGERGRNGVEHACDGVPGAVQVYPKTAPNYPKSPPI